MKRRILTWLTAVCMAVSMLPLSAMAAGAGTVTFADVTDKSTAVAVETLRLMGVLDGYGDGSFRPDSVLNRAQFCKMVVYAMAGEDQLGRYSTVTVFPDVKPSHWAAGYINMAAKGKGIIAGYPDGKFHPDQTVTVGQAVTILLRLLEYKDENVGGVWPDSYMAVGAQVGLTDGVGSNGNAPLTRGQAARLFLNLLRANKREGGSYLSTLGTPVTNTMLVSATATGTDGKNNALQIADGTVYQLASGKTSNGSLNGLRGTMVVNAHGQAVTFVPDSTGASRVITLSTCTTTQITDSNGVKYTVKSDTKSFYNGEETSWGSVSSWVHAGTALTLYLGDSGNVEYIFVGGGGSATAAVVVYDDHSATGFDALTGGITGYSIYKNGASAGLGDLRKYDVAIYSAATNSIRVCDTRVTVYYESCKPNPKEPTTITALGQEFDVLPTAMESLSKFKPGDQMTLLLTEGGQVAGAVEASGNAARSNAVGIVSSSGTVQMLCGTAKIEVKASNAGSFKGQLVRISASKSGVTLSRLSGGASGELNVSTRKLGSVALSENVMVFRNGEDVALSQLTSGILPASQITYARTNWAGQVDLIVLGGAANTDTVIYGRAVVKYEDDEWVWNADKGDNETKRDGVNGHYETVDGQKIWVWNDDAGPNAEKEEGVNGRYTSRTKLEVDYGSGLSVGPFATGFTARNGDYVAVTLNKSGNGYASLVTLDKMQGVSNSAWSGQSAVTIGGRTYTVASDVPCYNKDAGTWISLDAAHAYASTANIYVSGGAVRVIEVSH
ncbi:S-layer homology domain-containing protein [Oscillibacter sp.]|uniref:S-layer homology domain-containing protein n=1 Tax=Oscillibacter sp. TaxID=1945593 RepID=UPI002626168A|nr:S-layer homology domain-containing protein [Oscillibacter sp.]MDD3347234.1 S-layer homology domain-containing protein [Oscillibacter sp.]